MPLRLIAPCALLLFVACRGEAPPAKGPADAGAAPGAPAPEAAEAGEDPATPEQVMRDGILRRIQKCGDEEFRVAFGAGPAPLPGSFTIDIEQGAGHGFSLSFLRLKVAQGKVDLEDVEWEEGYGGAVKAEVWRRSLDRAAVEPLLALVDLSRRAAIERIREATQPPVADGGTIGLGALCAIGGSADFFDLVRILDDRGRVVHEAEYAGYVSGSDQERYLPLEVVREAAGRLIGDRSGWTAVPRGELRASHFGDAFSLNARILLGDFHWWVREYSLKALAAFGTPDVLPALERMRSAIPTGQAIEEARCARYGSKQIRKLCRESSGFADGVRTSEKTRAEHVALIDRLMRSPETTLEGPPAALTAQRGGQ